MKYTDKEKTAVVLNNTTIPRNHRLWYELGVDKEEEANTIEEYVELIIPYTELRSTAYKEESDPLFFECYYNDDLNPWKDKVAEIKKRYSKNSDKL